MSALIVSVFTAFYVVRQTEVMTDSLTSTQRNEAVSSAIQSSIEACRRVSHALPQLIAYKTADGSQRIGTTENLRSRDEATEEKRRHDYAAAESAVDDASSKWLVAAIWLQGSSKADALKAGQELQDISALTRLYTYSVGSVKSLEEIDALQQRCIRTALQGSATALGEKDLYDKFMRISGIKASE